MEIAYLRLRYPIHTYKVVSGQFVEARKRGLRAFLTKWTGSDFRQCDTDRQACSGLTVFMTETVLGDYAQRVFEDQSH